MKKTITESEFIDSFGEGSYKNNFSYYGKIALYNYLTELEEDMDTEIELDTIALCCEFTEYADIDEIKENYTNIKDMDDLRDNTQVIEFNETNEFMDGRTSGIIIQNF